MKSAPANCRSGAHVVGKDAVGGSLSRSRDYEPPIRRMVAPKRLDLAAKRNGLNDRVLLDELRLLAGDTSEAALRLSIVDQTEVLVVRHVAHFLPFEQCHSH